MGRQGSDSDAAPLTVVEKEGSVTAPDVGVQLLRI
jgi:hypothetical protein